jgi:hypothetical protein
MKGEYPGHEQLPAHFRVEVIMHLSAGPLRNAATARIGTTLPRSSSECAVSIYECDFVRTPLKTDGIAEARRILHLHAGTKRGH